MGWVVIFEEQFEAEFNALPKPVQDELLARAKVLEQYGPSLGRPTVDTLKASRYPNMKELRFNADRGVWRVAFAFDPKRQAILLVCGDKATVDEKKFYKQLIEKADERFDRHVAQLKKEEKKEGEIPCKRHSWKR